MRWRGRQWGIVSHQRDWWWFAEEESDRKEASKIKGVGVPLFTSWEKEEETPDLASPGRWRVRARCDRRGLASWGSICRGVGEVPDGDPMCPLLRAAGLLGPK